MGSFFILISSGIVVYLVAAIWTVAVASNPVYSPMGSVCGPGHQTRESREAGSATDLSEVVALARDARV
jgi:hypothetical protein